MKVHSKVFTVAAFLLLSAALSFPTASAGSCTVTGSGTCVFSCSPGDKVYVVVNGVGHATGTCGGATASCTTASLTGSCHGEGGPGTSGGTGTCTVVGNGSCSTVAPTPPPWACPHPSPHSHNYGSGGSAGARSDTASAGRTAGVTTVSETNAVDCDGDGTPGDYDGDWETGIGGGFFGYGHWANEPICQYGLTVHGNTVTVTDFVFSNDVQFVIGADDTDGPVISTDPVSGETTCETDGRITPGDPAQDPTRDADDCLTPVIDGGSTNGQGTTCGAGGDGGYWVFLIGARVHETGTGVDVNNPATSGTITA